MERRTGSVNAELLIDLIRASLLGEAVPDLPPECDPRQLITMIGKQHLTNLVFPLFLKHPHLAPLRKPLERDYLMQIPKITNQNTEIQKFLAAAEAKGLDCIPLKGYLLRQLYPDPMMRSMSDFDVLIRNMDNPPVRPWMESMGFVFEEDDDISPHHDNYVKEPWMYMELHRHLMGEREGRDLLEKNIWSRCRPMEGKEHIFLMSDEDFYIFHLLHLHHHFVEGGCGIKNIIDIYVFLQAKGATLDREYLNSQLKALHICDFASYMEHLAYVLLGDTAPDDDSRAVTDYMMSMEAHGSHNQHRVIQVSTGNNGKRVGKFRYLLLRVFPTPTVLSKHYPSVMKYKFLLPCYWVANAWRVLFVKKTGLSTLSLKGITDEQCQATSRVFDITGAK